MAGLFAAEAPTVVLGLESRGCVLGPLVAVHLGVGFVEVRKRAEPLADADAWLKTTTPPNYRDRQVELAARRVLLEPGDRALLVDDWMATGGQGLGVRRIVDASAATWLGAAILVDALPDNRTRRALNVRSLLNVRDL